ncbi:MAG: hypothetical protein IJ685_14205, partial [Selenomonadaceae bacterium]|nr:hypothetical protein [Selenomonadaceae bacterium]
GGTGNDTLYFGGGKNIINYASGDGNDLIYNWSANDTISITGGSYTRSTVGSDVVFKVGNGAITLKGAKNSTINVKGTLAGGGGSSKVSIPSGAFTYNGHSYYIFYGLSSWEQAKAYCESRGGHLAVITSSGENSALFNYMKRAGYDSAYFGLSDASKEGTWTWTNGERVSYTNWASGEPNGGTYENYGMFYYVYTDGKWNDGNFSAGSTFYSGGKKIVDTNAFICEWDTVKSSTPVTNVGVNVNNTVSNKTVNGTSYADTITNSGQNVTITSGAGNDKISNNHGDNSSIVAGDGNDSIYNRSYYTTINGGDGNDTITNFNGAQCSLVGGAGADRISLGGDTSYAMGNVTVNGGKGNDSIYGDAAAQLFQYASGDGNDLIYNWSANDTISITGGSYTRSTVGSDVVLKVGSGAVTLKGAKYSTVNVKGTLASGGGSTIPVTQPSGNVIYGTNGHDNITNSIAGAVVYAYGGNDTVYNNSHNNVTIYGGDGADSLNIRYSANVAISGGAGNDKVTVYSGNNASVVGDAGNDTVKVYGTGASISGGEGADYIENDGNNALIYGGNGDDYVDNDGANSTIYAESGNDYIYSYGSNVKVYGGSYNDSIYVNNDSNGFVDGGTGNDTIRARYANNVSLKGNAGNDFIDLYSVSCVIAYNSGDGNDTVTGFDGNDTLKVYGSYTRSTVGNDVVVKVGSGSITLKNAKGTTLNISNFASSADLVSSADLASDDWISADDTNFVTSDTRLDSIVETPATNYSVGNFDSALTSLTQKNNFLTFTSKK